jgi:hypothetical protein
MPRLALAQPPAAAFAIRQSLLVAGRCVVVDIADPSKLPSAKSACRMDSGSPGTGRLTHRLHSCCAVPRARIPCAPRKSGPLAWRLGAPQTVAAGDGFGQLQTSDQKEKADDQRDPFSPGPSAPLSATSPGRSRHLQAEARISISTTRRRLVDRWSPARTSNSARWRLRQPGRIWLAGETARRQARRRVDCTGDDPAKRHPSATGRRHSAETAVGNVPAILEHASASRAFLGHRLDSRPAGGRGLSGRFRATFGLA